MIDCATIEQIKTRIMTYRNVKGESHVLSYSYFIHLFGSLLRQNPMTQNKWSAIFTKYMEKHVLHNSMMVQNTFARFHMG